MARKTRTIGGFVQLWQRHEALYRNIFYNALVQLIITDNQRQHENAISEKLCLKLREVCYCHMDGPPIPVWEGPISPVNDDELTGGKGKGIPDFTCSLVNSFASSHEMYEIPFCIECKRLGNGTGSWNLNKNYVEKGINRYDCPIHEYGKRALSGMMIGYIVNSEKNNILEDVNSHLPTKISALRFLFQTKVEVCDSTFNRSHVDPKDFKLIHIWVDLRNIG